MLNLTAALALKDPALTSRWFVLMPDTASLYECVAETIEASFLTISPEARYGHGTNTYYPGLNDVEPISITFYETYDYAVTRYIVNWMNKIVHSDGSYGLPVDYKRTITAHLYYLGSNTPALMLQFSGCWPTTKSAMSLQYESESDRYKLQCNFSVDGVKIIDQ